MTIARDHVALLVIDMQNGFLQETGSMARIGFPHTALLPSIPGCAALVDAAHAAAIPVITPGTCICPTTPTVVCCPTSSCLP